jgi:ATP-binding cassette subfamily C protein
MLIAFQSLMQSFLAPVIRLIDFGATLQELQTSLYQLDDVLNNPALPEAEPVPSQHLITPKTFRLQGEVQVHHVTFHHSPVSPPIIEDVSFSLTPGKRVAVVGSSGSGKSTLAKLVAGLYEPTAGEIRCDGVRWSQVPRAVLTHSIAMVDQEIAFFAGTLRENLTLWDATVADHQLIQACKDAAVHDVIMAIPGGYDSLLREGGVNLSGGERQRLELARALVNDPAVLILDEATSALDAAVELRIFENLCRRGCASLIVAHRLSTIRDCDEIIVLDAGRVVQQGPHDHLVWEDGPYRHLLGSEAESFASQPRLWSVSA